MFVADRTQYVIVSNTKPLYSTVLFGKGITNDSDPIERALGNLREFMHDDGQQFIYHRFIAPASATVRFAKALDRSVTGSMNDLVWHAKMWLVEGELVRTWAQPKSEGCVADDETGRLYLGEEENGISELGAEPDDEAPGKIIIPVTEHGFKADVEGLTILYGPGDSGYLIASSQGNRQYKVFERKPPHAYVTTFTLAGVRDTDGIDVINVPLGTKFPAGVFTAHHGGARPFPVVVCDLSRLGLETWTRTNPRR